MIGLKLAESCYQKKKIFRLQLRLRLLVYLTVRLRLRLLPKTSDSFRKPPTPTDSDSDSATLVVIKKKNAPLMRTRHCWECVQARNKKIIECAHSI